MIRVPGGTFERGAPDHDRDARPCERPRHRVTLRPFLLDRTEVTVAAYAEAVAAGAVPPPVSRLDRPWEADIVNWGVPGREQHPVNGVTWGMADGYCRWRGKRLPTEAEFELVLGGGRGTIYPWGDDPVPPAGYGNYAGEEAPEVYAHGRTIQGYRDDHVLTAPVGSFPPDALGFHDLSGNVWEWCSDRYGEDVYARRVEDDPRGPPAGERRILRGGGHHCVLEELRVAERHHKRETDGSVFSGFRCARDLEPGR